MAGRTGYEPAWDSDSSLGRHQLELEERVELLLFLNAHDHRTPPRRAATHATATLTIAPRSRNTTSFIKYRLTLV